MMRTAHSSFRYLGGAVLCALVNNAIFIAGDGLAIADALLVIASWLAGGTVGYLWHSRITFRRPVALGTYARFMIGMTFGVPLTWISIKFFRNIVGWPMTLTSPATTVVLFLYNFSNARLAINVRRRKAGSCQVIDPENSGRSS